MIRPYVALALSIFTDGKLSCLIPDKSKLHEQFRSFKQTTFVCQIGFLITFEWYDIPLTTRTWARETNNNEQFIECRSSEMFFRTDLVCVCFLLHKDIISFIHWFGAAVVSNVTEIHFFKLKHIIFCVQHFFVRIWWFKLPKKKRNKKKGTVFVLVSLVHFIYKWLISKRNIKRWQMTTNRSMALLFFFLSVAESIERFIYQFVSTLQHATERLPSVV